MTRAEVEIKTAAGWDDSVGDAAFAANGGRNRDQVVERRDTAADALIDRIILERICTTEEHTAYLSSDPRQVKIVAQTERQISPNEQQGSSCKRGPRRQLPAYSMEHA